MPLAFFGIGTFSHGSTFGVIITVCRLIISAMKRELIHVDLALAVENWGWYLEFTPAFIGSGMLVGLNVSISFFMGSVLAWGIIGPALVHNGAAWGVDISGGDPNWDGAITFASLSLKASNKDHPSPRYWLLWPGVLLMVAVSFTGKYSLSPNIPS
jgi:hypothetical protein